MPNETIADICSEMKREAGAGDYKLIEFSDRIEAAAQRSHCGCDDSCEQFRVLEREHERLRAKLEEECKRELDILNDRNALYDEYCRLRAALKQVLDYDIDTHPCDGYCVMLNAVREAQRIAMEGEAK